ncbi:hypothetical protein [Bordetella petrii]|uniref:hypothetical protein n=1 Tax=Bordetella petrii TaxID=94624 RepID=UPI00047DE651|nr:hypothetical protein [Bordetella petrii]
MHDLTGSRPASNWLYPEAVQDARQACIDFLAQRADIAQTQAALRQSEQTIVALEESGLRALLFEAENQLEEIRFTVPDKRQPAAAAAVIRRVLDGLCQPGNTRR